MSVHHRSRGPTTPARSLRRDSFRRATQAPLPRWAPRRLALAVGTVVLVSIGMAAPVLAQETHVFIITGVAGDEEHVKQFHKLATTFIDGVKKRGGVPEANIVYLSDKPETDPSLIRGRSTRENVERALTGLAANAKPSDEIFLLLIGHGSFDGQQAAFNLPGPDLTASDWAKLLKKFQTQRVVFVNTASASGAFLAIVAGPGRTIVTATKTGGERNETSFAQFFVEAYADETADLDRNGRVSVLEAFNFAKTKVLKAYEQKGTLLTEHAALDDGADGKLAATMFLGSTSAAAALGVDTSDPEMRALVGERDTLDKRIAELKLTKDSQDPARYEQELEKLLTELAVKTRAIRDLQAKKDTRR